MSAPRCDGQPGKPGSIQCPQCEGQGNFESVFCGPRERYEPNPYGEGQRFTCGECHGNCVLTCPGCPECRKCKACDGEGWFVPMGAEVAGDEARCPRCAGTGVEKP